MTVRALPNGTVKTLREVLDTHGGFTDQEFIRRRGMGRRTLANLVERRWAEPVDPAGTHPRRFRLIGDGLERVLGETALPDRLENGETK